MIGDVGARRSTCAHDEIGLLNPWEFLRKYVCADCGAVMTCSCGRDIATYVLPHQATRGIEPLTREEVPVTRELVENTCFECRGTVPPAYPRGAHRGATSVIHRYYWHELWTRTQIEFLRWCRENDVALLDDAGLPRAFALQAEHAEVLSAIESKVLTDLRSWHAAEPRYDTTRPSDAAVLTSARVNVVGLPAAYLTPSPGPKALVVPAATTDASLAVPVEEFAADHYRRQGREVMELESRPFQCLFGCLMWMWVSEPADPRNRAVYFGGRDGVGADDNGLIAVVMPEDFGSANHGSRRQGALHEHLDVLPDSTEELIRVYDCWLDYSRPLRQYLWAYTKEDETRARKVVEVLGARTVKKLLAFLAEDYWERYLGWPDLLTWRLDASDAVRSTEAIPGVDDHVADNGAHGSHSDQEHGDGGLPDVLLAEVKSSSDRLSDDQRAWIRQNANTLKLPFEVVKVHRTKRLRIDRDELD